MSKYRKVNSELQEVTSLKTIPSYEEYPFEVEGISTRSYITKEGEKLARMTEDGKLIGFWEIPESKTVAHDSLSYTKIFQSAALSINFKEMSISAANLLMYIAGNLSPKAKSICLSCADFLEHFGYSPKSESVFYGAVSDLVKQNILKRRANHSHNCYWINANVIFNGDRTKAFKDE